jgi:RNase adaptor protein for sRNA GlmZ degradation
LAERLPVAEALAEERLLMAPLKAVADRVIDTSDLALPTCDAS